MPKHETATLGGGCFWCLEAVYQQVDGVLGVESGYAGGHVSKPSYSEVCAGKTGHIEVIRIEFDPEKIAYRELLDVFFAIHDPTSRDRQGEDAGEQYRSVIFTHSDRQRETAQAAIEELNAAGIWDKPIVTEVTKLDKFYVPGAGGLSVPSSEPATRRPGPRPGRIPQRRSRLRRK